MDERIRQEKVPIRQSAIDMDLLRALSPELRPIFQGFKELPDKIQKDIIKDIKRARESKMSESEIWDRLEFLVKKGKQLDQMTTIDSDVVYKPKDQTQLTAEEQNLVTKAVDRMVAEAQKISQKDNFIPRGRDKYLN